MPHGQLLHEQMWHQVSGELLQSTSDMCDHSLMYVTKKLNVEFFMWSHILLSWQPSPSTQAPACVSVPLHHPWFPCPDPQTPWINFCSFDGLLDGPLPAGSSDTQHVLGPTGGPSAFQLSALASISPPIFLALFHKLSILGHLALIDLLIAVFTGHNYLQENNLLQTWPENCCGNIFWEIQLFPPSLSSQSQWLLASPQPWHMQWSLLLFAFLDSNDGLRNSLQDLPTQLFPQC